MAIKTFVAAIGILALLNTGAAYAQAAAAKTEAKPRTAKSLECSKQADTKNLHGKPRKKFMSSCKKS
jgi:hypothetical protein